MRDLAMRVVASLPLLATPPAQALEIEPGTACAYLQAEGLAARGGYDSLPDGSYRCSSAYREIHAGDPVRNEVRFVGSGTAGAVREVRLELAIRSHGELQRSHREFLPLVQALTGQALGRLLPPEVEQAVLGGTWGQWSLGESRLRLERVSEPGGGFEYRFAIR